MTNPAPAGKLLLYFGSSSELEGLPSESNQAPNILLHAEFVSDSLLLNASSSTRSSAFYDSSEATACSCALGSSSKLASGGLSVLLPVLGYSKPIGGFQLGLRGGQAGMPGFLAGACGSALSALLGA